MTFTRLSRFNFINGQLIYFFVFIANRAPGERLSREPIQLSKHLQITSRPLRRKSPRWDLASKRRHRVPPGGPVRNTPLKILQIIVMRRDGLQRYFHSFSFPNSKLNKLTAAGPSAVSQWTTWLPEDVASRTPSRNRIRLRHHRRHLHICKFSRCQEEQFFFAPLFAREGQRNWNVSH